MEIKNKKAYFDYFIIEEIEAGIVLTGSEIKSVRDNKVQLKDSFVKIMNNEAFLVNMHISKYKEANINNHEEERTRKLLLHKKEIYKLKQEREREGITIVPLKIYIKNDYAKVLIGVAKGKKLYDKRESIKKRDLERMGY